MLTKLWAGEGGEMVLLDWQAVPGGGVEVRLSQLTRWVLAAERLGLQYGLAVPGRTIAPGCGDAHFHACLRVLATSPPEEESA